MTFKSNRQRKAVMARLKNKPFFVDFQSKDGKRIVSRPIKFVVGTEKEIKKRKILPGASFRRKFPRLVLREVGK